MMHVLPVIDRTINEPSVIDVLSLSPALLLFLGGATRLLSFCPYVYVCLCQCSGAPHTEYITGSVCVCVCDNSVIVVVGAVKAKGSDGRSRSKPAPSAVLKAS